ncbi:MAG: hypothetical protein K2H20_00465, partial [Bacilli bacterium]|nr:hypothetical protein [Bacilli bacterium]
MKKEEYIIKAKEIHGDKYDYESLPCIFKGTDKIPLTCKKHGLFYTIARNHIHGLQTGCPECGKERVKQALKLSFEDFVIKAQDKHGHKYEYFKEHYTKASSKTKILCKKCNKIFEQVASMHLCGNGCPNCNPMPQKLTHEFFVNRLKETHPNLEVLSEYLSKDKPIIVRCIIHDYTYTTT